MNRNGKNFSAEYSNIPGRVPDRNTVSGRNYSGNHMAPRQNPQGAPYRGQTNIQPQRANVQRRNPDPRAYQTPRSVRTDNLYPVRPDARYHDPRNYRNGAQQRPLMQNNAKRPAERSGSRKLSASGRASSKKRVKNTFWRDFMLGLGIGFAIFGTAAIFVVRAITDLFI